MSDNPIKVTYVKGQLEIMYGNGGVGIGVTAEDAPKVAEVLYPELTALRRRAEQADALAGIAEDAIREIESVVSFISSVSETNQLAAVRARPIMSIKNRLAAALAAYRELS